MAEIRTRDRSIQKTPELSPALGAGDIQSAYAGATGQLDKLTSELLERKKRIDRTENNTWLIDTENRFRQQARKLYTPLFGKKGSDLKGDPDNGIPSAAEQTKQFFNKMSSEISKNAPSEEYKNMAMERFSHLYNGYEDRLIVHQTKEIEVGNLEAISRMADEQAEEVFTAGGTVDAIEVGIQNMDDYIAAYAEDYGQEKAEDVRRKTTQHIANNAISRRMRIDPEGTISDLETGKYSKYITSEERDKHLKNARGEAKYQKAQADQAIIEAQDDILAEIIKNPTVESIQAAKEMPAFQGDAKGQSALSKIESALVKEAATETRHQNYVDTMQYLNSAGTDLRRVTDTDLMNMVGGNLEDFGKVKTYRDKILSNPSEDKIGYKSVLSQMQRDYKNGMFGDDPAEALSEYVKALDSVQEWALKNPGQSPIDYYTQLSDPLKIGLFDRALSAAIPFYEDPIYAERERRGKAFSSQRRQTIAGQSAGRANWLERAKRLNPNASEQDLNDYYDNKYGGR